MTSAEQWHADRIADFKSSADFDRYTADARECLESDATDEQVFDMAMSMADRDDEEEEAERIAAEKDHVWDRIDDQLRAAGFVSCGRSSKSASRYYGTWSDADGRERVRVSDHSVAYRCSDCAVCVEVGDGSPDADVTIGERADDAEIDNAIALAVELFRGRCPEEAEEEEEAAE